MVHQMLLKVSSVHHCSSNNTCRKGIHLCTYSDSWKQKQIVSMGEFKILSVTMPQQYMNNWWVIVKVEQLRTCMYSVKTISRLKEV